MINAKIVFYGKKVEPDGKLGKDFEISVYPIDDELNKIYNLFGEYKKHDAKTKTPYFIGNFCMPMDKVEAYTLHHNGHYPNSSREAFESDEEYNDYVSNKEMAGEKYGKFYAECGKYLSSHGLIEHSDLVQYHKIWF